MKDLLEFISFKKVSVRKYCRKNAGENRENAG
jgi:hypothetical protein